MENLECLRSWKFLLAGVIGLIAGIYFLILNVKVEKRLKVEGDPDNMWWSEDDPHKFFFYSVIYAGIGLSIIITWLVFFFDNHGE